MKTYSLLITCLSLTRISELIFEQINVAEGRNPMTDNDIFNTNKLKDTRVFKIRLNYIFQEAHSDLYSILHVDV